MQSASNRQAQTIGRRDPRAATSDGGFALQAHELHSTVGARFARRARTWALFSNNVFCNTNSTLAENCRFSTSARAAVCVGVGLALGLALPSSGLKRLRKGTASRTPTPSRAWEQCGKRYASNTPFLVFRFVGSDSYSKRKFVMRAGSAFVAPGPVASATFAVGGVGRHRPILPRPTPFGVDGGGWLAFRK